VSLTAEQFLDAYPEFETAPEDLLNTKLAEALGELNAAVYGSKLDAAHGWLTAHKIASSPYGRNLRQQDDESESVYWKEYARIRRLVAPRAIVT
jgi:hypothetical protein